MPRRLPLGCVEEPGETAKEILARKDLERRSGIRAHKTNFGGGLARKVPRNRKQVNVTVRCQRRVYLPRSKNQKATEKWSLRHRTYLYGGNIACSVATHATTSPDTS